MTRLASFVRSVAYCLSVGCFALATDAPAQTLQAVKQRGTLICGVSQGVIGFSSRSQQGRMERLRRGFLPRACGCDLQ
jgi:general L-amino acid transport system substrate-binding protein